MPITDYTCFKGFYELSFKPEHKKDLDCYIDEYESYYMCCLLGKELYDLLLADLGINNVPQTDRFIEIWEPFCKDVDWSCICKGGQEAWSKGIKKMLTGFMYYHYLTGNAMRHTAAGMVRNVHENSMTSSTEAMYAMAEQRYNEAIKTYRAIQACIESNPETYPEYKGKCLEYKFQGLM